MGGLFRGFLSSAGTRSLILAAASLVAFSGSASASITFSETPGTAVYSGPTPTYDFETPAPVTGGIVSNTSVSGIRAQPFGSTGNYWAVGPGPGNGTSPGLLDLSSFTGGISSISFIWGSVDKYNSLDILGAGGSLLRTITGADVSALSNGNQSLPDTNPLVTLNFTDTDQFVSGLRLSSGQNAFETDNYAVSGAVPEPGTWALMLLGFGGMGIAVRRGRKQRLTQLA